jgi:transcriptional regulator with XRE-family HTH domain
MTETQRVGRAMPQDKDENRQILASRLKESREYLDLSQDEVARILGIPRTAISLMEAGQRKVDAIELKQLAEIYQRSIDYFTGGADAPIPSVPESVQHLARTAAKLSARDREELLQFAQFLQARQPPRNS